MVSMTTKYMSKVKKDIYDYSCIIESVYKLNNNALWDKYSKIKSDVEDLIEHYVIVNYFNNINDLDNPVLYFNKNIVELKDYIKKYFSSHALNYDDEAVLLSIILCMSTYFRKITEKRTLSKDEDFKKKIYKFIYAFKDIKQLNINLDNKKIKRLSVKLYKTSLDNKNFFIEMNKLPNYNIYKPLTDNYYEVKFKMPNEVMNQYNYNIVNETVKKYNRQFTEISYQVLGLKVLRDLINGNYDKKYVINFDIKYLDDMELLEIFGNDEIKNKVYLLLNFSEYGTHSVKIKELEKNKYNFIYDYQEENANKVLAYDNLNLLVSGEFKKENKDNLDDLVKKNINIIEKKLGE